MPIYEDASLPSITPATEEQKLKFQVSWLNKRVAILEAIVFEMLRDRVPYEQVEALKKQIRDPGLGPNTTYLDKVPERYVHYLQQGYPPENLGWPPVRTSSEPDDDAD